MYSAVTGAGWAVMQSTKKLKDQLLGHDVAITFIAAARDKSSPSVTDEMAPIRDLLLGHEVAPAFITAATTPVGTLPHMKAPRPGGYGISSLYDPRPVRWDKAPYPTYCTRR
jgi:hypothetical protein